MANNPCYTCKNIFLHYSVEPLERFSPPNFLCDIRLWFPLKFLVLSQSVQVWPKNPIKVNASNRVYN